LYKQDGEEVDGNKKGRGLSPGLLGKLLLVTFWKIQWVWVGGRLFWLFQPLSCPCP
jgi:hypothetical protein